MKGEGSENDRMSTEIAIITTSLSESSQTNFTAT
jgi:hypothetical protein